MFLKQKYARSACYKNIKKSGIIFYYSLMFALLTYSIIVQSLLFKASFIVALDRLLLIDYCITNPAVIK